jgi:hypothetical protein
MLPDWDFYGDDAKRRAFIRWVEAELDRFAMLTADRYAKAEHRDDWPAVLAGSKPVTRVGRPAQAFDAMNAMIWEFGLLRYMFGRYWPDRKRPIRDAASAVNIAVARCRRALPRDDRTPDRLKVRNDRSADLARKVCEEWDRGTKTAGRCEAELDIAFLDTLPPELFVR